MQRVLQEHQSQLHLSAQPPSQRAHNIRRDALRPCVCKTVYSRESTEMTHLLTRQYWQRLRCGCYTPTHVRQLPTHTQPTTTTATPCYETYPLACHSHGTQSCRRKRMRLGSVPMKNSWG